MNMRKKLREFFTMTRRAEEGFTLVELIVVIAIVAILGGVAVPAYSGYIEKADRAADAQLLADVNKAFAAACMVKGVDNFNNENVPNTLTIGDDHKLPEFEIAGVDGFKDTFKDFYEGGEFKKTTQLKYVRAEGRFVDPNTQETVTVTIGGFQIQISKELAEALQNNTFSEKIGAEALLGKVDTIADIAALLVGATDDNGDATLFNAMTHDPSYQDALMKSLNMNQTQYEEFLGSLVGTGGMEAVNKFLANSLVLTAAQKTQGLDTSFLGKKGSATQLRNELDNPETSTEAMAKLALTYGMYTSYVKEYGKTDNSEKILNNKNFEGMREVLEELENDEFQQYLTSDKGKADLNAYMSSMQIVNNSANSSPEATKDILTNGFTDPELVAALNGLMNPTDA